MYLYSNRSWATTNRNLRRIQKGTAQIQNVEGHAVDEQKQIRTSSWLINYLGSSPHEVLQFLLINAVYH